MTTHEASFHLDRAGVKALLQSPEVVAATEAAAAQLKEALEAKWPEEDRKPTTDSVKDVFVIHSDTMVDGRPAQWIAINHPSAVARQAKTRFITRTVAELGLKMSYRD